MNPAYQPPEDIFFRDDFRRGFAQLAPLGLTFDAWLYHPKIPDLTALARAFPETPIVLDHVGGPLGIRGYAGKRDEVFADWRKSHGRTRHLPERACEGRRARACGSTASASRMRTLPPSSDALVAAWKPYMDTTIELFGAARCMFESNFPVDKGSYGYGVFWNACKKIAAGASAEERTALFSGTASRFYKLG